MPAGFFAIYAGVLYASSQSEQQEPAGQVFGSGLASEASHLRKTARVCYNSPPAAGSNKKLNEIK